MSSFLALYHGKSIGEARLVAVSADPDIVAGFAARLLQSPAPPGDDAGDPVLLSIERGRQRALRLIARRLSPATPLAREER